MFKDIILIALVVVFIVDLSGAVESLKNFIKINGRTVKYLKPFDCSLCMTFWTGLFYLVCVGAFTLPNVAAVCLVALCTSIFKEFAVMCMEAIKAVIRVVYRLIDKVE